ncbi:hypothetical protein [Priestia koreensis]|uniref:hypothetical protein n=1 Tax=Priestia koreensis TaxID=284581 RepID=UPI003459963C
MMKLVIKWNKKRSYVLAICVQSKTFERGMTMTGYVVDFLLVAMLVIGFTAIMGVTLNGIGERLLSHKRRNEFVVRSNRTQEGWNKVGGKKK